jgi:hypothetical protein
MEMKRNSIFLSKDYNFLSTATVGKFIYLKNQPLTEASRRRIQRLIDGNKVRVTICSLGTTAISRP